MAHSFGECLAIHHLRYNVEKEAKMGENRALVDFFIKEGITTTEQ